MSSNLVGKVVANQFRVDAFISAGGMGTVFRVWDLKRNVPLAMKVLHADLAEDQTMFERFKREARALRKLEHPNIVPFYGLYQVPSLIFLLERFIDGPTLKEVLAQRSASVMRAENVLCIIKALCSAVGYAHSNNVIHCDIKAANVMIDQGGQIYLGDFGIARHAESDVTAMPGAGTPAYMAPEQILGRTVSRETDIYALGILLFELLTGQRPFRGNETSSERSGNTINERIRFAQLNLPAPDPRLLNPNISPLVSAIVLRALEKDPRARFSSCQELFSALCQAYRVTPEQIPDRLSNIRVSQPPVTPADIPITPAPSKPTTLKSPLVFIGGAVLLVILMVFVLIPRGNSEPPSQPQPPSLDLGIETLSEQPSNNNSQPAELVEPTDTQEHLIIPTDTVPIPTRTPTLNPGDCGDGILQHVEIGDRVEVCTQPDRLILRQIPAMDSPEIFRIYPGVDLVIIDGPKCDSQHSFWKVRVKAGSWVWNGSDFASKSDEEGWVREGGYDDNVYYICPVQ